MFAGAIVRVASGGGRSGGAVAFGAAVNGGVDREREIAARRGRGGGRDCGLLFFVQRIFLLVEVGAVVWSALRGGMHSVVVRGVGRGVAACDTGLEIGVGGVGGVQRVGGVDGGRDDFAIIHAG